MGLINRAFDTSTEMYAHIDNLASCPVLFPLRSLGVAKRSINQATRPPLQGTATSNQSDSYGEQFLGDLLGRAITTQKSLMVGISSVCQVLPNNMLYRVT